MLSVLTFRTPDEAVEKANNTMYGLSAGVWTEKGSRILWMADRLRAGVVWGNTFNRFDPASPFGGYKESGFGREGGRHGLEAYLRFRERRCAMSRLPVRKTYKLFIGGAFPRSESGRTLESRARTSPAPRARTRATRSSRRGRAFAGVERRRPPTTAARCSTGSPRRWRRGSAALAAVCSGRREVARAIDRVVWYAGWADKLPQVLGCVEPRRGPVLQLHAARADRRRRGGRARRARARRPRRAASCRRSSAATRSSSSRRRRIRSRRSSSPRRSRRPTCPAGVVNVLTGLRDELAPVLAAHMDVNAIDVTGADGEPRALEVLAAENVKRVVRAREERSPWEIGAFMELKTVWHPIGR